MKTNQWIVSFLLGTVTIGLTTTNAKAAYFKGLGDLPGGDFNSLAFEISADGSTVVGRATTASGREGFIYDVGTATITGLGDLPGGDFRSVANAVSGNGSIVVGGSSSTASDDRLEALIYDVNTGTMTGIGDLPGNDFESVAFAISADGSTVVGTSESINSIGGNDEAFVYDVETATMTGIGDLPGGDFFSRAFGVSGDGSLVVGESLRNNNLLEAFIYDVDSSTMTGIGDLPGGLFRSSANAISVDGSTVVGQSTSDNGNEAFIYDVGTGTMTGIGDLAGGGFLSEAFGVSADGSTVVGSSSNDSGEQAFIYDQMNGMESIEDILMDASLDLTGWNLVRATGISGDGLTVAGWGFNPDGNAEAWVANLEGTSFGQPIPEPLTILGAGTAVAFGAAFKRKLRKISKK